MEGTLQLLQYVIEFDVSVAYVLAVEIGDCLNEFGGNNILQTA
jgi:hypothetical protein